MDRLDAMRLFVRVAELGSFSAVALQLGAARSVVTRQIAALESHLGTKLLARSTRRLSLTSAGTAYLEKCREILNLVEIAETGLAEERQTPRGPIRLSLPLVYSLRHLAPLLIEFSRRYPEVELDMDFSDRRSNLIQEGIDLAVRITPRSCPSYSTRFKARTRTCRVDLNSKLPVHSRANTAAAPGSPCTPVTTGNSWRTHRANVTRSSSVMRPVRARMRLV